MLLPISQEQAIAGYYRATKLLNALTSFQYSTATMGYAYIVSAQLIEHENYQLLLNLATTLATTLERLLPKDNK